LIGSYSGSRYEPIDDMPGQDSCRRISTTTSATATRRKKSEAEQGTNYYKYLFFKRFQFKTLLFANNIF